MVECYTETHIREGDIHLTFEDEEDNTRMICITAVAGGKLCVSEPVLRELQKVITTYMEMYAQNEKE